MSGCRIGRVKLKGGATIIPLKGTERDDHQAGIIRAAGKAAAAFQPGEIRGYLVISFDRDGAYSVGWRLDEDCSIGTVLLPSWLADIVRREMVEVGAWA